ncbi:MAG: branched-chain amino acid transport system permease protein [Moorella sp. (in: firmicutes)]|nr:branched-chain amino acid transport system permease protein [Moorella sp. (in: firmicutes)]
MKQKINYLIYTFMVLVALIYPLLVSQQYYVHMFIMIFIFAAVSVGWNLISGYAAQLSLGHSAFFAIGAYSAVLLVTYKNLTPFIGGLLGILLAIIAALIIGYPCFRLRGPYFTLATIASAEILRILLLHFQSFTGGANGVSIPFKGQQPLFLQFYDKAPYYYFALGLLLAVLFIANKVQKSKTGYYLTAIREDQDAAESLGIKTHQVKLTALLISAAITAVAGILYAFVIGYIDPDSVGGLNLSIEFAVIAIVGGIGTLWGPVIGSVVVILLTELTNMYLGSARSGISMALYGLLLIFVIILRPQGLISLFNRNPGNKGLKEGKF